MRLGQYNKEVYVAEGVKDQNIEAAEGYASSVSTRRRRRSPGSGRCWRNSEKAPEITKTRLYLEAMSEVVPQLGKKIIMDEDASQVLPLYNSKPTREDFQNEDQDSIDFVFNFSSFGPDLDPRIFVDPWSGKPIR